MSGGDLGGGGRGAGRRGGGGWVFLKNEGVNISICRGADGCCKGWVKFSLLLLLNFINKVNTI